MCHYHIRVALSVDDKEDVRRLSGILIPIYATAMVLLVAFVMVAGGSQQGEIVASTAVSASTR